MRPRLAPVFGLLALVALSLGAHAGLAGAEEPPRAVRVTAVLVQGDVVAGVVTSGGGANEIALASRSLGRVTVSLDRVLRVFVDDANGLAVLPRGNTDRDQVYLRAGGHVDGVVNKVSPDGVEIDAGKALGTLSLSFEKLSVVVLGQPGLPPPLPGRAKVSLHTRDGSVLTGELVRAEPEVCELRETLLGGGFVRVPEREIDQLIDLAD